MDEKTTKRLKKFEQHLHKINHPLIKIMAQIEIQIGRVAKMIDKHTDMISELKKRVDKLEMKKEMEK